MVAKATLSDLRNAIQEIYREVMREQSAGETSNTAVLEIIKTRKAAELGRLNSQLVDIALTKLLNDVGNRRTERGSSVEIGDLFGGYSIPRIVSIARGKKKNIAKLSFREAELYVKAHSARSESSRHEPLRRLLDECRKYVKTDDDTLEILVERKRQAEQLNFELTPSLVEAI